MSASVPTRLLVSTGLLAACLIAASLASAAEPPSPVLPADLTSISLEELTEIRVTSLSKSDQSLRRTAGAVYVVTAEDIRRSGATILPEALRLVPGLHVARIDANKWAIGVRGLSGRFASSLMVLVDGRSVYAPFAAGVYWGMQDVAVETIERIEVLRGPGAAMWGTNAVNGVINVVTKRAEDTQGGAVDTSVGSLGGVRTAVRYGGELGDGFYRLHGKYHDRNNSPDDGLSPGVRDEWGSTRLGFRLETPLSERDQLEVFAEGTTMEGFQRSARVLLRELRSVAEITAINGSTGYLMGRWTRDLGEGSDFSLQGYVDRINRSEQFGFGVGLTTTDLEFQHRTGTGSRVETAWGLGYRSFWSDFRASDVLRSTRPQRQVDYFNGFAQQEIQLVPDELYATLGIKLEHNSLGGFAPQPTARMLWAPNERVSLWGAVSRATRSPFLGEQDFALDLEVGDVLGTPVLVALVPNPDLENIRLTAFEGGARWNPTRRLGFDVALFENHYHDSTGVALGEPFPSTRLIPHVVVPVELNNHAHVLTRGGEVSVRLRPVDGWNWTANYSYLHVEAEDHTATPLFENLFYAQSPRHQASLRWSWNWRKRLKLDASGAYVGETTGAGILRRGLPLRGFLRTDGRAEWKANDRTNIAIGVHNLFDARRYEFDSESLLVSSPAGRNVYGSVEWVF